MFPDFLRSKVLISRSAACEATRRYHVYKWNCPSFHLWWKKHLVKHQKVSKYFETDFLQSFLLLFMFLLTAKFVKNSHILARIFFIFLKNAPKRTWNSFNTKFQPQWKDRKSSYKLRQILGLFRHLIALILG